MKTGAELIAEERQRQIEVEGYSAQHDSQHDVSEFIYAAIAYIEAAKVGILNEELGETNTKLIGMYKKSAGRIWPWGEATFKPTTNIRDLVKTGALVAAIIDLLQAKSNIKNIK